MSGPTRLEYEPRGRFADYHTRKERWSVIVAHRRRGKTVACLVDMLDAALRCKKKRPQYGFISPLLKQAKANAWGYLKDYGLPIPGTSTHENELRLNLPNGGMIRLFGSDNPETFRGMYFDGVVLDEYGDMHPRLFPEIIRPALSDRTGWATWIGTPKGPNDFYDQWQKAKGDPKFFTLMLRASEAERRDFLSDGEWRNFQAELVDQRAHMTPEQYAREYECSFAAPNVGVYYGKLMETAAEEGRILPGIFDRAHEVHTAWDLGALDTTIWFFQKVGMQIRLVDYYQGHGFGMEHYAKVLQDRGYKYGRHHLPHDVEQKHQGKEVIAHSRKRMLNDLGIAVDVLPKHSIEDGISAVMKMLPKCVFDKDKCAEGIKALQLYHREWDDERKVFLERPYHDWTSHPADAVRYLAMSLRDEPALSGKPNWLRQAKDRLAWIV